VTGVLLASFARPFQFHGRGHRTNGRDARTRSVRRRDGGPTRTHDHRRSRQGIRWDHLTVGRGPAGGHVAFLIGPVAAVLR
jgi:hypothetical protein